MTIDPLSQALSSILDAAAAPHLWPSALDAVTSALGVAGVGCVTRMRDGTPNWAAMAGLGSEGANDYANYYAARDPWGAVLERSEILCPLRLSDTLSKDFLSRDEWYNDFARKIGINNILAMPIDQGDHYTTLFAIHNEAADLPAADDWKVRAIAQALSGATKIRRQLHGLNWASAISRSSLSRMSTGVVVVNSDCKIIDINAAALRITDRNDGLLVRACRLAALKASETARLAHCVAAIVNGVTGGSARMSLRGSDGRIKCVLTISQLSERASDNGTPLALVLAAGISRILPTEGALKDFFGLSSAEARITVSLMAGKRLKDIAHDGGVQITTARSQLSSILRKAGVARQTDLLRVVAATCLIDHD
jgi:DNA-binding NarL/FixJ family response regulator